MSVERASGIGKSNENFKRIRKKRSNRIFRMAQRALASIAIEGIGFKPEELDVYLKSMYPGLMELHRRRLVKKYTKSEHARN